VVSVYVEKWGCVYGIDEERIEVTVLFLNASAKCFALTDPI
jgi:hypothetical protein